MLGHDRLLLEIRVACPLVSRQMRLADRDVLLGVPARPVWQVMLGARSGAVPLEPAGSLPKRTATQTAVAK